MKNVLTTLGIVGATILGSAQAATTLYGSLAYRVSYTGGNITNGTTNKLKDHKYNLQTKKATIGIKGSEDLGKGLQTVYQMEFNSNNNSGINNTGKAYLGIKGDFGSITFGKQDSVFKPAIKFNDQFKDCFFDDGLAHFATLAGGNTLEKAIVYNSPNFKGFQFGVAGVLDGSHTTRWNKANDGNNFFQYQLGLQYKQNGFFAGIAYSHLKVALNFKENYILAGDSSYKRDNDIVDGHTDVVGGSVGYSNDKYRVGFGVEHAMIRPNNQASSNHTVYNLGAAYNIDSKNIIRVGFSLADYKGLPKYYNYAVGYQHNFSKRTYSWIEGTYYDYGNKSFPSYDNKQIITLKNKYMIKVGIRHDF